MEKIKFLEKPPVVYGSIRAKPYETDINKFKYSRVLIAENNEQDASVIVSILDSIKIDYTVTNSVLSTTKDIVEFGNYYDLIFINHYIPENGAKDLIKSIRVDSRFDTMPIVVMLQLGEEEPIELIEVGANGFVEKPLMRDNLYSVFDIFIDDRAKYILKIDDGLEHTNGIQDLYISLLKDFLTQYKESDRNIIQHIYREEYEKLGALIVDIDGLSGTIGAELLHKVTQIMLEKYREEKYYGISYMLPIYKNELKKVINAIDDYLLAI